LLNTVIPFKFKRYIDPLNTITVYHKRGLWIQRSLNAFRIRTALFSCVWNIIIYIILCFSSVSSVCAALSLICIVYSKHHPLLYSIHFMEFEWFYNSIFLTVVLKDLSAMLIPIFSLIMYFLNFVLWNL